MLLNSASPAVRCGYFSEIVPTSLLVRRQPAPTTGKLVLTHPFFKKGLLLLSYRNWVKGHSWVQSVGRTGDPEVEGTARLLEPSCYLRLSPQVVQPTFCPLQLYQLPASGSLGNQIVLPGIPVLARLWVCEKTEDVI